MDRFVAFDPPVAAGELPARIPSPFDPAPHPLARRAAAALQARLAGGAFAAELERAGGGKMFGVLVAVAPDGRVGYLRGFSGMLAGRWEVDGFVPPLFDAAAKGALWPAGEAALAALDRALAALDASAEAAALAAEHAALTARHAAEAAGLTARHAAARQRRRAARQRLAAGPPAEAAGAAALQPPDAGDPAAALRAPDAGDPAAALRAPDAGDPAAALRAPDAGDPAAALRARDAGDPAAALRAPDAGDPAAALRARDAGDPAAALRARDAGDPAALRAPDAGDPAAALRAPDAGDPAAALHAPDAGDPAAALRAPDAGDPAAALRAPDAGDPAAALHAPDAGDPAAALHALDQASRADSAERRRCRAAHSAERADLSTRQRALAGQREAIERLRADRSRHYLAAIHDTYVVASAAGERLPLAALFAGSPPGGAGDCAAPKLVGHAHALGLRPVALAEFWWGAPPVAGGRRAGAFYPACRGKCGPILPHMLAGLPVAPAPLFGAEPVAADQPHTVFEDRWLLVIDKPCGLLSVPGRSGRLRDSVQTRLERRLAGSSAALVVHRLDLDTSGLLLVARDRDTHAALQRLFARREIDKRYVAWLAGEVAGDAGVVDLALRVDLDDRPRQIDDPVHGRGAVTGWRVLERRGGRTRVALFPHTGRTHQLRLHAAHPLGLGAAVVGDRLYGGDGAGGRLLLHAEALALVHPRTGRRLAVQRPAPF